MDIIVIAGPTASGKTATGVNLAKQLNGEIISGDSMQVYRHMDIGTAKVTTEEMKNIPHHMIDIIDPDEPFSAADFTKRAKKYIIDIKSRNKLPILVGGSGFYINALLGGVDFDETSTDIAYRDKLYELEILDLYNILKEHDPAYAQYNKTNKARLVRGLEYFHATNKKISDYIAEQKNKQSDYNFQVFVLDMPRPILYERINKRVDHMIQTGLVEEVEKLLNMGYNRSLTSMSSIGYKEIIQYKLDEISLEQAVENIKKNTRRFAKRQLTWFRNKTDSTWIDKDILNKNTLDRDIDEILQKLKCKKP